MRLLKILLFSFLLASLVLATTGCSKTNTAQPSDRLKVVVSIYPVYEFAKQVGGDKVAITMLVPPGAAPHDWEPTARELLLVKSAKLFLYHGAGFENIDKLLTKETLGQTKAVALSQSIPLLTDAHEDEDGDDDHHKEGAQPGKEHVHADSHMWLDPVLAQQQVLTVAEALSAVDPANRDYYYQNAAKYRQELATLDQEYRQALTGLSRQDIVTSHAAFGYLTKRYNLKQIAIMGLSPDSEPTPERMANIIKFSREHRVKYIFFETLVSPKLSETIAKETGARLLVLNPLENLTDAELKQGKTYLTVMRENLVNLKTALSE